MPEETIDYGIKYQIIKLKDDLFFLRPIGLVEGYASANTFYNEKEHKILNSATDLAGEEVVDSVFSASALKTLYDFDDISFIKEYFLAEEKDKVEIIVVRAGKMQKLKIDIRLFEELKIVENFEIEQGKPFVSLNETAIEDLLSTTNVDDMRAKLLRYRSLVQNIKSREKKDGTTKIVVQNGSITQIENRGKIITSKAEHTLGTATQAKVGASSVLGSDISLSGLEQYIKERVFGHDTEIRKLSKTIIMNFTAESGEKNEPILLLGPTGTGKTETMHAISSYLNIPLIEVNSVNLVPQGIKGMSLEDCLYSLIVSCNYDLEKAQRGIIFFDEFDKLGLVSNEYKSSVSQILLKFIEGSTFLVDKPTDDYNFDTSMLIKIFAGAFSNLFDRDKKIGFGSTESQTVFKPQNITEKKYFGKELITRIPHIILFSELSYDDKKRAILSSKISEYLIKQQRYRRQFGVELEANDEYITALLAKLDKEQKSMRDLNNLIISTLDEAEYEMLSNPHKYKKLILSADTVSDNTKFKLL